MSLKSMAASNDLMDLLMLILLAGQSEPTPVMYIYPPPREGKPDWKYVYDENTAF